MTDVVKVISQLGDITPKMRGTKAKKLFKAKAVETAHVVAFVLEEIVFAYYFTSSLEQVVHTG